MGLAAGDALGTTLEFSPPGSFDPIDDMVGGGPFGLRAGQWTDDTSMALCLAISLLESGGFDPVDQMGALPAVVQGGVPVIDGEVLRHRRHPLARPWVRFERDRRAVLGAD